MAIILSQMQELAASYHEGRRIVIATAGAGKTTALAMRIVRLIQLKHCELEILATSFTNASAKELKERIDSYLGRKSKVVSGTFHSYCISLISKHHKLAGFDTPPRIVGPSQFDKIIERLILQVTDAIRLKDTGIELEYVKMWLSELDIRKFSDNPIDRNPRLEGVQIPSICNQIWEQYNEKAKRECFMSYDDILTSAVEILRAGVEELPKYIFVDEAQDLSGIQWLLVEELGKKAISTDVIGDDDQSIYAWRGARPKRFTDFADSAEKVFLTSNRRCGSDIVSIAKEIIEKIPSSRRIPKDLSSSREDIGKIRYSVLKHVLSYQLLAREIRYQVEHEGKRFSDYAIIARAAGKVGGTFELLQNAFTPMGVPFRLLGGDKRAYDRTECDFLKSLLSLSHHTGGETPVIWENLMVCAGTTAQSATSILREAGSQGKVTLESLRAAVRASKISSNSKAQYDALINCVYHFRDSKSFNSILSNPIVSNMANSIISREVREKKDLSNDEIVEMETGRVGSFGKLFDPFKDLSMKEASVKLLMDFETANESGNVVTISTAHSAKGLEWDCVYVVEANNKNWPNKKAIDGSKGLPEAAIQSIIDEEIRLLYVAATRAKNKLNFVSLVEKERLEERNEPSRFLPDWARLVSDEVFNEVIERKETRGIDLIRGVKRG